MLSFTPRGKLRRMIAHAETYRFSADEFFKLVEVGILEESDRIELLDGELVIMAPIGKRHAQSVRRLNRFLNKIFNDVCLVDCQNAVMLDEYSVPQPDIVLVNPEIDKTGELPRPADVLLAIEVSDSSLPYYSTTKLRAYARAGVREYWIVNLDRRVVEVHRAPEGENYEEAFSRGVAETLAPAAFPDRVIPVAAIMA